MRELTIYISNGLMAIETLLALQLYIAKNPSPPVEEFLLRTCQRVVDSMDLLILSPPTTEIDISFARYPPLTAVASVISVLPTISPNLKQIDVNDLGRHPVIIEAALRMLLACNRNSFQLSR